MTSLQHRADFDKEAPFPFPFPRSPEINGNGTNREQRAWSDRQGHAGLHLEARQQTVAPALRAALGPQELLPQQFEGLRIYVNGALEKTWQPGLPTLIQYGRTGDGIIYTSLIGPETATLPPPPLLGARPEYRALRRASWGTFGASAIISGAALALEMATVRQEGGSERYFRRLTLFYGASAVTALTLSCAIVLEWRF